jgi:hypothetical protein
MPPKLNAQPDDFELFRSCLENIIDQRHPLARLARLARLIDWPLFEARFGALYVEEVVSQWRSPAVSSDIPDIAANPAPPEGGGKKIAPGRIHGRRSPVSVTAAAMAARSPTTGDSR